MNWELIAVQLVGVLLEFLVTYNFFETMLVKKSNTYENKNHKYLLLVILFLTISITNCFINNSLVSPFMQFIAIIVMSLGYVGEWKNKLSLSLLLSVIFVLSEMAVGMTTSLISSHSMDEMSTNLLLYFEGMFVSKMVTFLIVKIIGFFNQKHNFSLKLKTWAGIMIIPITSIIAVIAVVEVAYMSNNLRSNVYVLLIAVCLIAANAFVFYLFEKELKIEEDKLKFEYIENQLEDQKQYYDIMAKTQEKINKTAHDMKNSMTSVLGAILSEEYKEAEIKLKKMIEVVQNNSYIAFTGKITIDTMLNMKAQAILDRKIVFKPQCLMSNGKFNDIDFCIILGTLLDNSIEACEKMEEKNRYIKLNIFEREDFISCYIENPTALNNINSIERTTKTDKKHHGFGIENVRSLIKENGGSFENMIEDNLYKVSISFMINNYKK